MKPQAFRFILALALGSAFILSASAETRTWTSANGKSTFEAELLSYSTSSGTVKVKRSDGRELTFKQSFLSTDDIEFLKTKGDVVEAPAAASSSSSASGLSSNSGKKVELPKEFTKESLKEMPRPDGKEADMSKPVQVFIMMGQSNMVGLGNTGPESKAGSLEYFCKTEKKYPFLIDDSGNWIERKDVRCAMVTCDQEVGWLKPGFGAKNNIGPELGFGHVVGNAIDAPVLLIKACIGNRSLGWDLLPPGTEPYDGEPGYRGTKENPKGNGEIPAAGWYAGKQYDDDTANAKAALANLDAQYPGAKKYEIAGFVMWQAEKDHGNPNHMKNYEKNLVQFIKSLRKDFSAPNAKFVCATLGEAVKGSGDLAMEAQFAVDGREGKYPEFKGNVATVYANPLSNGGSGNGHYGNNAGTYMNVGIAMGETMAALLQSK